MITARHKKNPGSKKRERIKIIVKKIAGKLHHEDLRCAVETLDTHNIISIFMMLFNQDLRNIFHTFRNICLPIASADSAFEMLFSWHEALQAYFQNSEATRSKVLNALLDTGFFIGITAAVLGSLLFSVATATISPAILACTLGGRALCETGRGCKALYKALCCEDAHQRSEYLNKALIKGIAASSGFLATGGVIAGFILAKHVVGAILGVLGGATSLILNIKGIVYRIKMKKKKRALLEAAKEEESSLAGPVNELTSTYQQITAALQNAPLPQRASMYYQPQPMGFYIVPRNAFVPGQVPVFFIRPGSAINMANYSDVSNMRFKP